MREFFAPLPLAAVALMGLNDRYLKPAFSNWVTGKLSDVAVLFFLPLLISALLGGFGVVRVGWRLGVGAVATAASFAAVELTDTAGAIYCGLVRPLSRALGAGGGCVLYRDPSDLLALLLVPLAVAFGWHRLRTPEEAGSRARLAVMKPSNSEEGR
ncbi:MAG: hypothetical protein KA712_01095 [Myxococcales bacterium]|nr:hypothetical protein [Myxococcales bacterium]